MSEKCVLIVDNENLVCWSLTKMLKRIGCSVEVANTAAEAHLKLNRIVPDLVILDVSLPDADGLQLLKDCKKQRLTNQQRSSITSGKASD